MIAKPSVTAFLTAEDGMCITGRPVSRGLDGASLAGKR